MKKWSSFAVNSPTEIIHQASHPMEHERMFCDIIGGEIGDFTLTPSQLRHQVQAPTREQSSS